MALKNDSPIFLTSLECPVCGKVNKIETIRIGAYKEEGRDTDFCPKKRIWTNPKFQRYNPLLFFMATCEECYFTREFTAKYKDWHRDNVFRNYKLKTQKEKHLNEYDNQNSVVNLLGQNIDPQQYPLPTTINKILLGIYDEKFSLQQSNLDLGRYFLRIAWLYREYNESGEDDGDHLASHAIKIEDIILKLSRRYDELLKDVNHLKQASSEFIDEGEFPDCEKKTNLQNCYQEALCELKEMLAKYKTAVVNLKSSLSTSSDVMSEFSNSNSPLDMPFGEYPSYRQYLKEVKSLWKEVPLTEIEAMNSAAEYYRAAYEEGKEISEGNQAMQAVYMIAELCRRVGKNKEAKSYFNTAIKLAMDYIHRNKGDRSRTALAQKILELARDQGKLNLRTIEKKANVSA